MKLAMPPCSPALAAVLVTTARYTPPAESFVFGGLSSVPSRAAFLSQSSRHLSSALPAALAPTVPSSVVVIFSPLSQLLPPSSPLASEGYWNAHLDEETTGLVYYFNIKTGESVWEPPTSTFPDVELHGWRDRKSRRKLRDYTNKSKLKKENAANEFLGGLARLFEGFAVATSSAAVAALTAEKEPREHRPKMVDGKANEAMRGNGDFCEWHAYLDEDTTGLVYYFNVRTGESVWEPPVDYVSTHSEVAHLSRREQRLARRKLEEYRASEAWAQARKGFFGMVEQQVGAVGDQMGKAAAGLAEDWRGKLMSAVTDGFATGARPAREETRSSPAPGFDNAVFGWNEHTAAAPYTGLFDNSKRDQ